MSSADRSGVWRLAILAALLIAFVLVPFALLDGPLQRATAGTLAGWNPTRWQDTALVVLLLAADVFLPVPSSVISTYAGLRLGVIGGVAASWIGMTLGCVGGFVFGRTVGTRVASRVAGTEAWAVASRGIAARGSWMILVSRPVPVLAEASVIAAGSARMRLMPFLIASALSNLGVSLIYAYAGSKGAEEGSFLLAFGTSLALPSIAWALSRATQAIARRKQ